jgi:hypothetical protein
MKIKFILDAILLVLFAAMCNTNATGTMLHEVLGILYILLIGAHLILNRKWLSALSSGKLKARKAVSGAIVNALLCANLIVICATGVRVSHYLFRFAEKAPS